MPLRKRRRAVGPPGATPRGAEPRADEPTSPDHGSAEGDDDERFRLERPPHHDQER